jgi:acetolactate synthase II small subunit
MTTRIEIDFAPAEGAILRLVGLIERRGYEVVAMDVPPMDRARSACMALSLRARDAGRRVETLGAQIRRVHGVSDVRHVAAPVMEAAS